MVVLCDKQICPNFIGLHAWPSLAQYLPVNLMRNCDRRWDRVYFEVLTTYTRKLSVSLFLSRAYFIYLFGSINNWLVTLKLSSNSTMAYFINIIVQLLANDSYFNYLKSVTERNSLSLFFSTDFNRRAFSIRLKYSGKRICTYF